MRLFFSCLLRASRGGKKCGGNTEERCKGRWEIKDGWKQMRVRGGERGKNRMGNEGLCGAKQPTCWACPLPRRL